MTAEQPFPFDQQALDCCSKHVNTWSSKHISFWSRQHMKFTQMQNADETHLQNAWQHSKGMPCGPCQLLPSLQCHEPALYPRRVVCTLCDLGSDCAFIAAMTQTLSMPSAAISATGMGHKHSVQQHRTYKTRFIDTIRKWLVCMP